VGEGSVSSQGNVAPGELKMGIFEGEEFRPVITFNTTTLPNAGAQSASLFLRREALSGSNPVNGLQLRMSNGAIGETIAVEMEDFDAETDAENTPCVFGLSNGNGRWIRIELPESFLPLIDNTSTVQFMLTAPEGAEGLITFTNSNDPEFAPVLNVTHNVVTSVAENPMQTEPDVLVYPNPTADRVFVKSRSETIEQMQLFSQHGQLIQQADRGAVSMDLRSVASGIYILKVRTSTGVAAKRVVRQ
jgi:hypothetical protein